MKRKNFNKILATIMLCTGILVSIPTIEANAEWKQDNNGWWYTEGNSYVKGAWKQIDGNWYYFYSNGYMAHDTWIRQYYVGSNGAWTSNTTQTNSDPFASLDVADDGGHSAEDPEFDAKMAEWNK